MSGSDVVISNFSEPGAAWRGMLRFWWLPVLTLLMAIPATWFFTSRQQKIYRASTSIVVGPSRKISNAREITEVYNTLDRRSIMATLAKTPVTGAVREQVISEIGAINDYEILSVVIPDTNILEISADGPNPETTITIANATASHTAAYAASFYDTFELKILDPAKQSRVIRPVPARNYAVGGILGFVSGICLAFLASLLSSLRRPKVYQPHPVDQSSQAGATHGRYVGS
jgi:capsular polysaccharide biosynthesis protein